MATSESEQRREARRRATRRRVEKDAAPAGETALRSKPVRITADLAPELYRRFARWTTSLAEEVDAAKVSQVDVVRALAHLVTDDLGNDPDRAAARKRVEEALIAEIRRLKQ